MKNSKNNANVQGTETKKGLSSELLNKVGALIASSNIQLKAQISNNIFKKGYNEKNIRKSARDKMFKFSKNVLLAVRSNDVNSIISAVEILENHCTKYYVCENKFDKVQNYYTSQREDESTKENIKILETVFEIANSLKGNE